jgi:hypothetical protein
MGKAGGGTPLFFVADWRDNVVVEFDKLSPDASWRPWTPNWSVGSLLQPAGLALFPDGRLIVVDRGHHRLVVFSADRTTASSLAPDGKSIGSLREPTGVCVIADGSVLIADTGNHRIVRCASLDTPSWSAFGTAGSGISQFVAPTGIACDSDERLIIADPGAGQVVRIDAIDGSNWTPITLPAATAPARPYGVSASSLGILIADASTACILLLAEGGTASATVLIDGTVGTLISPIAAVEFLGELFVADVAGASVARFVADTSDTWTLVARLSGERGPFSSPRFPRIGGFTIGVSP